MHVPHANRVEDEAEIRSMVRQADSAELVTVGPDGYPVATLLPIVWTGSTVIAHIARAKPHWKQIYPAAPVQLVVTRPQAYISPSWYPSKAEHGRVVPTWNYSAVHLRGRANVHDDPQWLRRAGDDLVEHHESGRDHLWRIDDAPDRFTRGQLRAVVGIEVTQPPGTSG